MEYLDSPVVKVVYFAVLIVILLIIMFAGSENMKNHIYDSGIKQRFSGSQFSSTDQGW